MKTHIQIVAILHIAFSALSLFGALAVAVFVGMAGGIALFEGEFQAVGIIGIITVAIVGFLTLLALPGIIGGWALLSGRSWGRPLVLVLGALQLVNIPFGTLLGAYTLWVLLSDPEAKAPGLPNMPSAA